MNPKYCTSLEVSKELVKNGWNKDTEFWWVEHKEITKPEFKDCIILTNEHTQLYPASSWNCIDAPLAIELLEELPGYINMSSELKVSKDSLDNYWAQYILEGDGDVISYQDKSLSNALAKLWLYLKMNKCAANKEEKWQ